MIDISTATIAHGALTIIAFCWFIPLGNLIAVYKDKLGPNWFEIHMAIQISGTLIALGAALIIIVPVGRTAFV